MIMLPIRVGRAIASEPFESAQRELDTVLSRLLTGRGFFNGGDSAPYAVEVREDADHIYVEADLPGYRKEEVEVTLENQTLTISAEKKEETEKKDADLLLNERRYRRFLRSFTLPPTVDERSVDAKLRDGVLTVTLNKREETKPRKISVA
jgi:HSP20 family protein